MIDWRDITLEDKARIEEKICASGCHGADYGFANLFIWRKAYRPKIAFCDNRLLVGMPQWKVYAYPKGDGEITNSIELLLDEAHSLGNKLRIRGLTDKTLEEFLPLYGDRFEIIEDRDNADYIYTSARLCDLPGRHLSSKRNHIKHFERNGAWEFHKIAASSCGVFTSCEGGACGKLSSIAEAKAFASDLWTKIKHADAGGPVEFPALQVEGNTPPGPYYRPKRMDGEPAVFLKAKPLTDGDKCIGCGTCASVCSMGSIDPSDVTSVPGICIKCQACVTHCPVGAKYFDDPDFLSHKEMLEANFREEKQNRFWGIR